MPFSEYVGNQRIVAALQGMLRTRRVPHALLFSGPRGVGKFALARMFAQAVNCQTSQDDFCGACDPCRRIGLLAESAPLIEQGLAERGESPDAATVEAVPLILQTHPDVWALVADPVRLKNPVARPMLRIGQLRAVQRAAYFKPLGRRRVFILDGAETMRWDIAGVFLKILEEPPESATLILLVPNPYLLLPTILSRCLQFHFAPLGVAAIEDVLKARTELKPAERRLAAEMAEGSPGAAMTLDVESAARLRRDALRILERAASERSFAQLFADTAALAKNREERFEIQLEIFYSLLADVLELSSSSNHAALRNPALRKELESLSRNINFDWLARALAGFDELHSRLRRNVNRQIGLDAVAVALGGGSVSS